METSLTGATQKELSAGFAEDERAIQELAPAEQRAKIRDKLVMPNHDFMSKRFPFCVHPVVTVRGTATLAPRLPQCVTAAPSKRRERTRRRAAAAVVCVGGGGPTVSIATASPAIPSPPPTERLP